LSNREHVEEEDCSSHGHEAKERKRREVGTHNPLRGTPSMT
jgi:hypothetical protein